MDKKEEDRLRRLRDEVEKLKLETVIKGAVAIINGDVVKVGQRLGEFAVVRIGARTVELKSGGTTFVLVMEN